MTDLLLIGPALLCALATYIVGHETVATTLREGSPPWIGVAVTIACLLTTLIAVAAVLA